ncbi:hypothetical protein ACFQU7_21905 [Pseudoroseomonas wenyumeiae]
MRSAARDGVVLASRWKGSSSRAATLPRGPIWSSRSTCRPGAGTGSGRSTQRPVWSAVASPAWRWST